MKYIIPYNIGTLIKIVWKSKYSVFRCHINSKAVILEVMACGDSWHYALCGIGAWFDHKHLKKISDPTQKTMAMVYKDKREENE